jgi:hypothetical protein
MAREMGRAGRAAANDNAITKRSSDMRGPDSVYEQQCGQDGEDSSTTRIDVAQNDKTITISKDIAFVQMLHA